MYEYEEDSDIIGLSCTLLNPYKGYMEGTIVVHSSSSATLPLTSRTSGTSIATSRTSWWQWGFLPMKSSLSSTPRPNGRERNFLRT